MIDRVETRVLKKFHADRSLGYLCARMVKISFDEVFKKRPESRFLLEGFAHQDSVQFGEHLLSIWVLI